MRKIVYSGASKFIAVLLFIAAVVSGVLVATNGAFAYFDQDKNIYAFEDDFSKSWYVKSLLTTPENLVYTAYLDVFYEYDEWGEPIYKGDTGTEELWLELEKRITEIFELPNALTEINYYVQWDGLTFTNCGAENAEVLARGEYYSYYMCDGKGNFRRMSSADEYMTHAPLFENGDLIAFTLSCSIKEEVVEEYKAIWETQEHIVVDTVTKVFVCAVVVLLLFIYLLCVCGKNKDGEYRNVWIDNIWIEVHLAAIVGAAFGAVSLSVFAAESDMHGNFPPNLVYLAIGALSALGSLIVLTSLLSIIRNVKTHRLTETNSMIVKIAKWIWSIIKTFSLTAFGLFSKKTTAISVSILFVYTAIIGVFGVYTAVSPIWPVLGILLFGFASFLIAYRAKELNEIKKGVSEVRNGNVDYKIPELKFGDMKAWAGNINDIAIGLNESVTAKVKAERLKAELITNVSHDLKTPITSIISYTELLSKIEELPEEAKDYVAVISKKSDRLKRLTQDLFDISKAQSGNDDVVLEKLDMALLINQTLGEHDNEIQSSGLTFCVDVSKELFISADGRKMSRVLSNLINNVLKYAMKNTRAFITASEKSGTVEVEFKNVSAYPLTFNVEEITQRFVRGDESRTAEGNGLGLAIAKSYTEICNGTFDIVVDGDMFKVILKFKKHV